MKNPLAWGLALGAAAFGGIVLWGKHSLKLQTGDSALVPPAGVQLVTAPGVQPIKVQSLAALGGFVRVNDVTRVGNVATGTAGREIGLAVPVTFSVADAAIIDRQGQQFPNPEAKA